MVYVIGFLMVLEVIVCVLLTLLVLMQRPRQEGLGAAFGGGMLDNYAGAQATNVLQKATTYLGVALFVLTFALAVLVAHSDTRSVNLPALVDESDKKAAETAPAEPAAVSTETPAPAPAATEEKPAAEATPTPATTPAPVAPVTPAPAPEAPVPAPTPAPAPEAEKPAAPAPAPVAPESTPAPAAPTPAPQATEKPAETPAPATEDTPLGPPPAAQ